MLTKHAEQDPLAFFVRAEPPRESDYTVLLRYSRMKMGHPVLRCTNSRTLPASTVPCRSGWWQIILHADAVW